MAPRTLAHVSDLHLGRSDETLHAALRLRDALFDAEVDHVLVTGDVTHRGRDAELALFRRVFAPLLRRSRITLVPGNHDRLGDDVGSAIMESRARVELSQRPGLFLVRVDSTAPHNRFLVAGHGAICERVLDEVDRLLTLAPADALRVVALHHHVLPLPEEGLLERLATRLGWPFAEELRLGAHLVERVLGRADLVLHGHRHVPSALVLGEGCERPLSIFNAGSTTELGRLRLFAHQEGALLGEPQWLVVDQPHREDLDAPPARHVAARGVLRGSRAAAGPARLAPAPSA